MTKQTIQNDHASPPASRARGGAAPERGRTRRRILRKLRSLLEPRVVVHPALLAVGGSLVLWGVVSRARPTASRGGGPSFVTLADGRIASRFQLEIENETDESRRYAISLADAPDAVLRSSLAVWEIPPRRARVIPLSVEAAPATFHRGERRVHLRIFDDRAFERFVATTLLGPVDAGGQARGVERTPAITAPASGRPDTAARTR